jgi:hypothetical protein
LRVYHRHRLSGVVDEQLLARPVALPHHRLELFGPLIVVMTELAVAVAIGMGLPVFHPQQAQRHALAPQLLVHFAQSGWGMERPATGARLGNSISSSSSASSPSGSGQLNPAALACVMYSLTVLEETEQAWAIARCVSFFSYFNLRISSILRMDNLFWAISSSSFLLRKSMPYLF